MNTIVINGKKIITTGESVIINDKIYQIPEKVRSKTGNTSSIINDKIYINGYKFNEKTGTWHISYKKFIWLFNLLIGGGILALLIWLIYFAINHVKIV